MRWLLVLFAAFPLLAQGGVITRTLDFQDEPPGMTGRSNFNYGGLRFSPRCRISAGHTSTSDQVWLHSDLDNSNCDSLGREDEPYIPPNPDYLGFGENFYVDRHGNKFSLLEIAGVGIYGTEFTVGSSKGGVFHGVVPWVCCEPEVPYVLPWKSFELTGPLWTDITWFTLFNIPEFGWQPHQGWDDIRVSWQVDEPPTWLLLTLPVLGLLMNGLHRKVMKAQS